MLIYLDWFCECLFVELSRSDAYRFLHELGAAPAPEEEAKVFGVCGRHFEGLVQAALLVEVCEIGTRVVAVIPARLEEHPSSVG